MRILFNKDRSKVIFAETSVQLIDQVDFVKLDLVNRVAFIYGKKDTVSFSHEYTDAELPIEIAKRAIDVLVRHHGWSCGKVVLG